MIASETTLANGGRAQILCAETYFALWAAVIPATTLLVVPSIQGTTPAYLLALASIPAIGFSRRGAAFMVLAATLFLAMYFFSQFGLVAAGVKGFGQLNLVEPDDRSMTYRKTAITQGLYLVACVATFLYVREHFRESWMRYVFFGAWLLVGYGLYEWSFYAIFHRNGDFLGNREFHSGSTTHTGSWSQTMSVGPLTLLRLKSFTGEPSFFALVAVPYLALAIAYRRTRLATALLAALALSFSTTAYLGILCVIASISYQRRSIDRRVFFAAGAGAIAFAVLFFAFHDVFESMFTAKFAAKNDSGATRMFHMTHPFVHYAHLPLVNQIFGIGFGTVYLAGPLRVLLDMGIIGLVAFLAFFLYPMARLPHTPHDIGWKTAVVSLLFLYTISAAELFYPTTWMILGIAYSRLAAARNRAVMPHALLSNEPYSLAGRHWMPNGSRI